jgi:hypothetical protein
LRVNAAAGDAFYLSSLPKVFDAIAFSADDTLYGISEDQKLYTITPSDGSINFITDVGIKVSAMAINRVSGELWASMDDAAGKEKLYKIDIATGDTTYLGATGTGKYTEALAFDYEGNLFGLTVALFSDLYSIDKNSGEATLIGRVSGFNLMRGLVFSPDPVTSVEGDADITPTEFALSQNYPNPFNPSTKITFSLPVVSEVRLSIVDLLGQEIEVLKNETMNAGVHTVDWNANSQSSTNLSSGVYFYRIKAVGNNGKEFNSTMKMMLLK